MRKIAVIILLFTCLIISGCNDFEVETEIKPKFTLVAGTLAVEYYLGNLLILDEWEDINTSQKLFLTDDSREKIVKLHLKASDYSTTYFHYTVNGSIKVSTTPVEYDVLIDRIDTFPNVKWTTKDSVTISKENQKVISPDDKPEEKETKKL